MRNNRIPHNLDVVIVLAQKDFKLRYRNSVLGFLWSLLNPLAYMIILTIVFSLLLRVNVPNFAGVGSDWASNVEVLLTRY